MGGPRPIASGEPLSAGVAQDDDHPECVGPPTQSAPLGIDLSDPSVKCERQLDDGLTQRRTPGNLLVSAMIDSISHRATGLLVQTSSTRRRP